MNVAMANATKDGAMCTILAGVAAGLGVYFFIDAINDDAKKRESQRVGQKEEP